MLFDVEGWAQDSKDPRHPQTKALLQRGHVERINKASQGLWVGVWVWGLGLGLFVVLATCTQSWKCFVCFRRGLLKSFQAILHAFVRHSHKALNPKP